MQGVGLKEEQGAPGVGTYALVLARLPAGSRLYAVSPHGSVPVCSVLRSTCG